MKEGSLNALCAVVYLAYMAITMWTLQIHEWSRGEHDREHVKRLVSLVR